MKYQALNAEVRTVLGKKVKQLRREGLIPANVYGKGLASQSLQVKLSDFQAVFKQVGETGLVELKVGGKTHPVLIKNLQIDYSTQTPIHADFYEVNLKEKVKAMIPVELVGQAKAVTEKLGVLLQTLSEVEIEALPDRIPENIKVNVEQLAKLGDGITAGDLKTEEGVALLTDPTVTIARIAELAKEEVVVVPEAPVGGEAVEAKEGAPAAAKGAVPAATPETKEAKGADKPQEKKEKQGK
jgi:large subunit ribosomal protein L25